MNILNKNLLVILYMQLSLENYEANTGNENELIIQPFEELNNVKRIRNIFIYVYFKVGASNIIYFLFFHRYLNY